MTSNDTSSTDTFKRCSGCKKIKDLRSEKTCLECRERSRKTREENKKKEKKCAKQDCYFKSSKENDYCGKHQKEFMRVQIHSSGMKTCANFIRGCSTQLPPNYTYSKCRTCLDKDNKTDHERRNGVKSRNNDLDKKTISAILSNSAQFSSLNRNQSVPVNTTISSTQLSTSENTINMSSNVSIFTVDDPSTDPICNSQTGPLQATTMQLRKIANDGITTKIPLKLKPQNTQVQPTQQGIQLIENHNQTNIKFDPDDPDHISRIQTFNQLKNDGKTHRFCTKCCKFLAIENFIGNHHQITKTCKSCRNRNKIEDDKRSGRKRDYTEYENNPEVKKMREHWNRTHQYKIQKSGIAYRSRKIHEDIDKYWRNNAERMKKYRQEHPEKMVKQNEKRKVDPLRKIYEYKYSAENRGIQWSLSDQQAIDMFMDACSYCRIEAKEVLNGIDRLDNDENYVADNSVPCCTMCNFMKRSMDVFIFIDICEHILTHLGKIDGNLHHKILPNSISGDYYKYRSTAHADGKVFEISLEEFESIIKNPCHLCGKVNITDNTGKIHHLNGIDRFDSDIGYIKDNCLPCCTNCNLIKNNYSYDHLIDQMLKIYYNNQFSQDRIEITDELVLEKMIKKTLQTSKRIKKTPEQKREQKREKARLRKEKSRKDLKEKYNMI